jgi:hypothetical protein
MFTSWQQTGNFSLMFVNLRRIEKLYFTCEHKKNDTLK